MGWHRSRRCTKFRYRASSFAALSRTGEGFFAIGIAFCMTSLPVTVTDTLALLGSADYIADRSLATAVHLALHLKRPLFLEGEAGVGKTEIAKVLAASL